MRSEWKTVLLGDVCKITSSKRIFAKEYQSSGIPFYRGKEIIEKHRGHKVSTELFISQERFDEIKAKYDTPQIGDVLLSSVGTLGVPWYVDETDFYFKDGNLTWLRADTMYLDSQFLYLWLNSNAAKEQIDKMCIGSTQKALTIDTLNKFVMLLPPLETQHKIAAVLWNIKSKIALNSAINENLEQQAQALFKAWFVDFEPFGGVMPEDWIEATLGDVTRNIRTKINNNSTPVFSAVNSGNLVYSDDYFNKQVYSKDISKYIRVDNWDFAYNPARINIGSIGINDLGVVGCVSPVYVVFSVQKEYHSFFRFFFRQEWFKQQSLTRASGSVRQTLNYSDFSLIEVVYPTAKYAKQFDAIWKSYYSVIERLRKENEKLSEIRDTLLPKLMNGEIDVSEVKI